ncbi:XRE family transcriptional regulator [Methyloligella sp. 2.7D]|uniref:helix-turn-helix domain-containing protein n=1 Tax=unclassified Methyloligella TaxID=2625955 RepID=UPI00157C59AC|nr:XRE family transcriptional regulator [Methyloligella sp. GL2]QKP76887.1 helix-turn-helix transcriptional regulator [Methyloligella sp. GL2]
MSKKLSRVLRPSNLAGLIEEHEELRVSDLLAIDERVGNEIRLLRKARDKTIAELSEATGLSKGYLSQVERGISSPSVNALYGISRALGVTISWFFPPASEGEDELRDIVVRADKRRTLRFSTGITDELLSPNLGGEIELLRCTFEPHSESGPEPYTHRGEEAGIVVSGTLHLWIGDQHVVLNKGDSFSFKSNVPHRYANPSSEETVVIWSITPPSY